MPQPDTERQSWDCNVCGQHVSDIGPWCQLYLRGSACPPLLTLRARILDADDEGDGPLVNALCDKIRRTIGDWAVP